MITSSELRLIRLCIENNGIVSHEKLNWSQTRLRKTCCRLLCKNISDITIFNNVIFHKMHVEIKINPIALQLTKTKKNIILAHQLCEYIKQQDFVFYIELELLKQEIGINLTDYIGFANFKKHVLEVAQRELDFEYEVTRRCGVGGKVTELKFSRDSQTSLFSKICNHEFTVEQMNIIVEIISKNRQSEVALEYLKNKYEKLNWISKKTEIKNRYKFFLSIVELELD